MIDRYALFGHPVNHSRSPAIHHAFAEQTGQTLRYELIDVLPGALFGSLREFSLTNGKGLNITLPLKEEAYSLAEELSERAAHARSVNMILIRADGGLFFDNTDGFGLVQDIKVNIGFPITKKNILLLGAGGAARGAIWPLLAENPDIGKACDEIRDGYRKFPQGSHVIFYRQIGNQN
ncbi:MAG: type II toxin-antitoxin system RelE/ParE family toxin, partial [Gammaproteobacteria bacterium]|nr:type II toxin-antitoxin system RelE/ParE family toxin [Gammaproteobacteria bacterium]